MARAAGPGGGGQLCLQRCAAVLSLAVLLVALATQGAVSPSAPPKITVKGAISSLGGGQLKTFSVPVTTGFRAALWSHNHTVSDNVAVEIVGRNTTFVSYTKDVDTRLFSDDSIFVVVCHVGDIFLQALLPAFLLEQRSGVCAVHGVECCASVEPQPVLFVCRPCDQGTGTHPLRFFMNCVCTDWGLCTRGTSCLGKKKTSRRNECWWKWARAKRRVHQWITPWPGRPTMGSSVPRGGCLRTPGRGL